MKLQVKEGRVLISTTVEKYKYAQNKHKDDKEKRYDFKSYDLKDNTFIVNQICPSVNNFDYNFKINVGDTIYFPLHANRDARYEHEDRMYLIIRPEAIMGKVEYETRVKPESTKGIRKHDIFITGLTLDAKDHMVKIINKVLSSKGIEPTTEKGYNKPLRIKCDSDLIEAAKNEENKKQADKITVTVSGAPKIGKTALIELINNELQCKGVETIMTNTEHTQNWLDSVLTQFENILKNVEVELIEERNTITE